MILDGYAADAGGLPPPAKDESQCYGISGDYWVMSRDAIIPNIKEFCGQADKKKTFNAGTVNELELSINKLGDDAKGARDAPDCEGRFTRAVVDGCDGLNPKNPDNWKVWTMSLSQPDPHSTYPPVGYCLAHGLS